MPAKSSPTDRPIFAAADITAATVYEMPSSAPATLKHPPRGPVVVGIDMGEGDHSVAVTCELKTNGSILVIGCENLS